MRAPRRQPSHTGQDGTAVCSPGKEGQEFWPGGEAPGALFPSLLPLSLESRVGSSCCREAAGGGFPSLGT